MLGFLYVLFSTFCVCVCVCVCVCFVLFVLFCLFGLFICLFIVCFVCWLLPLVGPFSCILHTVQVLTVFPRRPLQLF